jgi:sulfur-carrier protein
MRIAYFAWLKARTGIAQETVTPPESVRDVAGLLAWLATRDEAFASAFANPATIRAAVGSVVVEPDFPLTPDAEVALFPPVTGG